VEGWGGRGRREEGSKCLRNLGIACIRRVELGSWKGGREGGEGGREGRMDGRTEGGRAGRQAGGRVGGREERKE